MTGWEGCWKFPTSSVPDLFAFFQPVLIPKTADSASLSHCTGSHCFLLFYRLFLCCLGVHMSFNLLSQAAERDKDAD